MQVYRLLGDIPRETLDIYKELIIENELCTPFSHIGFDSKGHFTTCGHIANLHEENILFTVEIEEEPILYVLNIDPSLENVDIAFDKYRYDSNQPEAEIFSSSLKLGDTSILTDSEQLALFVNGDTKTKKVTVYSIY